MRWSCPHCGISLAIADEKLAAGWSFSRCYKCGGYGLIRKAEVNLIKVDKAPPGEPVVLPEATEEPMLSQEASQNLARYLAKSQASKAASPITPVPKDLQRIPMSIPDPLPELPPSAAAPRRKIKIKLLPVAMVATGSITLISGIYLYVQGQEILEKTQASSHNSPLEKTSGGSPRSNAGMTRTNVNGEVIKPPALISQVSEEIAEASTANQASTSASAPRPAIQREPEPTRELTDQVRHQAMAPDWKQSGATVNAAPMAPMRIRAKNNYAKFRSGPGTEYPVVDIASPGMEYTVIDWDDRWFKVDLKRKSNPAQTQNYGWIRNDLVHLSSAMKP